jgi:glyoxylase-like metal-dependent hydrolase (beta-lactamase superfamily II)
MEKILKNPKIWLVQAGRRWLVVGAVLGAFAFLACGSVPAPEAPLTQQRPLVGMLEAASYPNSDTGLVLATMQQLLAAHRAREGYQYFGRLAEQQPARRVFFRSLQAVMQASMASDVPLLKRRAWVNDAITKLDEGARADPLLGRLARGLVFAGLPASFGKVQSSVDDLKSCLARRAELPFDVERGIYRALGDAQRKLGNEAVAAEMYTSAGIGTDAKATSVLGDLSVDGASGFRFGEKRLLREAEGVYVAEGYDFANIGFVVGRTSIVAIDAGTTEPTAREALGALRKVSTLPIKYVILTHGHWDHVGGLGALREPGTLVLAQAGFPSELERSRHYHPPFKYFFGDKPLVLEVKPDRLLSATETLREDGIELELIPAKSGETDDALFVRDKLHGVLFVGDAFMPYLGAPFVAEGSPEGYLGAIDQVLTLAPRRIVHGHPPLSRLFTPEVLPGLRDAVQALFARSLDAAYAARPLADLLHDNFLPESLRRAPKAVMPYLVLRDTFVQRTYAEHAGYWQGNGEGIEQFTRAEWAAALDAVSGSESGFVQGAEQLESRGDSALALRVAELGLLRYPNSNALRESRGRALGSLRSVNSTVNPFRFIVYSELASQPLAPVVLPP